MALDLFHKYLQSEFSDENLEFWLSCENYKQQETSSLVPLAVSIYNDFIVIQSPKEVCIQSFIYLMKEITTWSLGHIFLAQLIFKTSVVY